MFNSIIVIYDYTIRIYWPDLRPIFGHNIRIADKNGSSTRDEITSLLLHFTARHFTSDQIRSHQLHISLSYRTVSNCQTASDLSLSLSPSISVSLCPTYLVACFLYFFVVLLLPLLCLACLPLITNQMLVKRASFAPKFCESMSNKRKTTKLKETLQNHFVYSTRIGIVNKLPEDRGRQREGGKERQR